MKSSLIHFCVIAAITSLAYLNSLGADFQWDDYPHIVENSRIKNPADLTAIWNHWPSRFVCFYTFALNYALGRLRVGGYHAVNLIIHVSAALFAYLLVFCLPRRSKTDDGTDIREIAFWTALIFACHPLQTQSVTYIVQRCASLAGCLSLLALLCYFRSRALAGADGRRRSFRQAAWYCGGLIAGLLAMGSKESAFAVPLIIFVWELIAEGREALRMPRLRFMSPYLALALVVPALVVYTAVSGRMIDPFYYRLNLFTSSPRLDVVGPDLVLESRWEYALTQIYSIRTYLRLCFLPARQTVYYYLPVARSFWGSQTCASFLLLFSLILFACRQIGRRTLVAGGILWFFLALIPTSSILVIWPFVSEHHLYLALFGWALVLGACLERVSRGRPLRRALGWALAGSLIALTISRNDRWRDAYSLWSDALEKFPNCAAIYNSLSGALVRKGDWQEAEAAARRAMELNPRLDAYRNLFSACFNRGNFEAAEKIAAEHAARFPRNPRPYISLGLTLIRRGDWAGAIEALEKAIDLDRMSNEAWYCLGRAWYERGDAARAAGHLREAVRLDPDYPPPYSYLGLALKLMGEPADAEAAFREGLKISPGDLSLNYNLGLMLWSAGNWEGAESHLMRSLAAARDPAAAAGIANALRALREGRPPAACPP